ncbi:hypothetical protein ES708_34783 [subsurface metagenome]
MFCLNQYHGLELQILLIPLHLLQHLNCQGNKKGFAGDYSHWKLQFQNSELRCVYHQKFQPLPG